MNGDVTYLRNGWYVTHSGLLGIARRKRCVGIRCVRPSNSVIQLLRVRAFEATGRKSKTCRGFVGYGDADPSNVCYLVHGAEMRVAETASRQSRSAQGLRHWHLLRRGNWFVRRAGAILPGVEEAPHHNRLMAMETTVARRFATAFASHPPASTRSQLGQGLRDGFLRNQDSSRSNS